MNDNNVTFDADSYNTYYENEAKGLAGKLISSGLVKNKTRANALLIIISILLLASAFFVKYAISNNTKKLNISNDIKIVPGESVGYPQDKLLTN